MAMNKRTEQGFTTLADAAFEQAAQKVIQRAENSGTPVIVCIKGEVKFVQPQLLRHGRKQARRSKAPRVRKTIK
jgi:hypothetical protein